MFQIPKFFDLIEKRIKVVMCDTLTNEEDALGFADFRLNRIRIQKNVNGMPREETDILRTFLHELTHWILHQMQHELRDDEVFVDGFARLLTQFFKTKK